MITSLQNSTVKRLRKLKHAKERHKQSALLLEGTHLIEAACEAQYPLQVLCFTDAWRERHPLLWKKATDSAIQVEWVSDAVLQSISSTVSPDGVVACAASRRLWQSGTSQPKEDAISLGVMVEMLQDPGNLGTIIRTATGVGGDGLWLSPGCVDAESPKVLRASVGQWFRLPMATVDLVTQAQRLREQGVQVVATAASAQIEYWSLDLRRPTVFILGNEGAGLSQALMAAATDIVKIPLQPHVESLNVAVAAGVLLYEAYRQRLMNLIG